MALEQEGFQSVIAVTDYDQDREEAVVGSLLSWRPAGLIVTGLEHNPGTRRRLIASGVRVAELLDIDGPGLDIVVGYSNRAAGETSARHLAGRGLTPEAYRSKWGLPYDYPMVAASYAAQRSDLAKAAGLGRSRLKR